MDSSLERNQAPLGEFPETGWLLEKNLFDRDLIDGLHAFLQERRIQLQEAFSKWSGESLQTPEEYVQHQARVKEYEAKGLPKDLHHFLRGEFDLETRLNPRLVSLFSEKHSVDFFAGFLKTDNFCVHYPPMIRFKMADAPGSVLPPHQDGPYSSHLQDFITVWVPLVDIDDNVGGLILYEKSHLHGKVEQVANAHWEYGVKDTDETYPQKHVHMAAGGALLFPSLLIHGSAPQRSTTKLRYSIDFRIFRAPEDSTKSYYDVKEGKIVRRD